MLASSALRVMQIDAECFCEIKPFNWGLGTPLGLQEVEAPRISTQSTYKVGKVVSPMHWLPLPPQEISLVCISLSGSVDQRATVWQEELSQWKIPMIPLGIKPATFWLVVQCFKHCVHPFLWNTVNYPPNYTESYPTFCNVSENFIYHITWCYWWNNSLQMWQRNCLWQTQSLHNTSNKMQTEG
jgi:hypothetical protein